MGKSWADPKYGMTKVGGRRKGRHSKKDKYKSKDERLWAW